MYQVSSRFARRNTLSSCLTMATNRAIGDN